MIAEIVDENNQVIPPVEAVSREPLFEHLPNLRVWFENGTINYRDWECGFATVFTADYHVGKEISLDSGKTKKRTLGSLGACKYGVTVFDNAGEFAEILGRLTNDQVLTASTPRGVSSVGRIVTKEKLRTSPGCISRGKEHFGLQRGQRGLMTIDYDPDPDSAALSKDGLWEIIRAAIPGVENSGVVYWASSSSYIFLGEDQFAGLRGQRLYLMVRDAGDVSRAMDALQKRLWLAGHGRIFIAKNGSVHLRTPADATLKEDAKLDYAGGAVLRNGLEQRRPAPEVLSPNGWLDTAAALPDLCAEDEHRYEQIVAEAKRNAAPAAEAVKSQYAVEHARVTATKAAGRGEDYTKAHERGLNTAHAALAGTLLGDFEIELDDNTLVTVGEILDDRERYHLRLTKDPIERDYRGGHIAGKLFLFGAVPNLYSFAHGGQSFRLSRQPAKVLLQSGRSAQNANEYLRRLADSGDVFEKGGAPVRVLNGLRPLVNVSSMALELGTRFAAFKLNTKGEEMPADPPDALIRMVISGAVHGGLPNLRSYISHPFVTEHEVVTVPGYHEETGVYAEFDPSDYAGLPAAPSRAEVVQALQALWRPWEKFAFDTADDAAAMLGVILGVPARPGLDFAPGVLGDGPVAGSGKTLVATSVGALASGSVPGVSVFAFGEPDIELKKRMVSSCLAGDDTFIYDNVIGHFNSPTMAGCLTSGTIKDRILGASLDYNGPAPQHIFVTANNATLGPDLSVRFLRIRLNHRVANPATLRFDFSPVERVLSERVEVLRGCLIVMRAFQAAGSPHHGEGGYRMPAWDRLVRSAVIWLGRQGFIEEAGIAKHEGLFDPAAGMLAATADVGANDEGKAILLETLFPLTQKDPLTVGEILSISNGVFELRSALSDVLTPKPLNSSTLRSTLNILADQIIGGRRLAKIKGSDERWRYTVVRV